MRVLMVASHFPRPTNPLMGVWALRQAQALRRCGVEIEVIAMCDWVPRLAAELIPNPKLRSRARCPPESSWDGLRVHHPRWPRYHAGPHARLAFAQPSIEFAVAWAFSRRNVRAIASTFAPDVIYAHGSALNGEIGRRLRSVAKVPLVCHDHDYREIRACIELPSRRRHLARVCDAAAATVVVSSQMRDDLREVVPGARIVVLPNGADPDPERAPQTPSEQTVLCVSGFYPRKQIPLLIDVFAVVAASNHDARLRIIGDGAERSRVEAAIARHGLERRVTLLGDQRHEAVLAEMRQAAVFTLLSREEPFGVVYLEALAAGTPVVCTDDAGVTDVIEDGVHGRIVAEGQVNQAAAAVTELLDDPTARGRMGRAGRALVEDRLSWDTNARALVDLFESAVGHVWAQTR